MAEEIEIWRAANLALKHHGEDAWFHASSRADELLDEGELEGAAVWRKILVAIEELGRNKPKDGEASH